LSTTLLYIALSQSPGAGAVAPSAAEANQHVDGSSPAEGPVLPEIRVVGRIPRCRILADDPLDSVDLAPAAARSLQQVIKRDPATGHMTVLPDDDPVTGLGVWQRAGTRMDQYVFRVPADGSPLCIGARSGKSPGWGQLRQVIDAKPYHGKTVRVTLWAASRDAGRVWFWVASGGEGENRNPDLSRGADMAAESRSFEFRGTRRWTPVSLTMGPVRCDQKKLSFGVLLDGPGDLWIHQPEFQVIGELTEREAERECRALKNRRSTTSWSARQ
jgi:hypothetical protein